MSRARPAGPIPNSQARAKRGHLTASTIDTTRLAALVAAARQVRRRAHAPYSQFKVGAAVLDEQGRVHVGCNVENASYGLTVCAERNAVFAAVAAGARRITAVAVVTSADPPASPCGACRQVLAELAAPEAPVVMAAEKGKARLTFTVGGLLPAAFTLQTR